MLLREESEGLVAISQPAHAWVAGQLARHWGNPTFGTFAPHEEVCMAAALHDVGYLNWEQAPALNPATGLPYCFFEMPRTIHLDLWRKSVQKLMRYGRYPALLVSLHFTRLCHNHRKFDSPAEFELEKQFLAEQEALQTTLLTSLQNDFFYAPCVSEDILERNSQLLALWDWISLSLCLRFGEERIISEVPASNGVVELKLTQKPDSKICIEPWPFMSRDKKEPIRIICEGRRLLSRFTDETKMREALRAGSPVTVRFELMPG